MSVPTVWVTFFNAGDISFCWKRSHQQDSWRRAIKPKRRTRQRGFWRQWGVERIAGFSPCMAIVCRSPQLDLSTPPHNPVTISGNSLMSVVILCHCSVQPFSSGFVFDFRLWHCWMHVSYIVNAALHPLQIQPDLSVGWWDRHSSWDSWFQSKY